MKRPGTKPVCCCGSGWPRHGPFPHREPEQGQPGRDDRRGISRLARERWLPGLSRPSAPTALSGPSHSQSRGAGHGVLPERLPIRRRGGAQSARPDQGRRRWRGRGARQASHQPPQMGLPMSSGREKVRALAREILNDAVIAFVNNPNLPPTNNDAERALRHAVIARRLSFDTRTDEGSRFYAAGLSVIETCRKRGVDVWNYVRDLITAARAGLPHPPIPTAVPVA